MSSSSKNGEEASDLAELLDDSDLSEMDIIEWELASEIVKKILIKNYSQQCSSKSYACF